MPRSSREKSAETRSNIVDAAYQLFVERGYNAASMREISRNAGVTVGAIYNHFNTKEDIWKEVILTRHPYHQILPLLQAVEGETVSDVVRSTARVLVAELGKRTDLFNLMFIEVVEFHASHAPLLLQAILPRLTGLQEKFLGKPGKVRRLPVPVLIRSFVGLFFSYYVSGIFVKNIDGVAADEETLEQFVDLYLYGILEEDCPPVGLPGSLPDAPRNGEEA